MAATWNTPQNSTVFVNEGENFTFFLDYDSPNTPILLSGTLPGGVVYDRSQAQLLGKPDAVDETTTYPLSFRIEDGNSNAMDLAINIVVVNSEPVWITQPNLGSFASHSFVDLQLEIFSPTKNGIDYFIKAGTIPDGLNLSENGRLSGLISAQTGIYEFTISTNVGITQTFVFIVDDTKTADPYFTTLRGWIGNIFKDQFFSFQFSAKENGSYSSSNLPDGLTLSSNGFLSGTPTSDDIGKVFFDVSINGVTQNFFVKQNVFIEDNDISIITNTFNYTIIEDEPSNIGFSPQSKGNVHTFEIIEGTLPSGLELQPNTGLIIGKVNKGTTGTFELTAKVTNNIGGEKQFVFTITVNKNTSYAPNKVGVLITGDSGKEVSQVFLGYNIPYDRLYRPSDRNFGLTLNKNIDYIRYTNETKETIVSKLQSRISSFGKPNKFKVVPVQDSNGKQICDCILLMVEDDNSKGENFGQYKLSSLDLIYEDLDIPSLSCYNWQSDFFKTGTNSTLIIENHDFYTGKSLYFNNQDLRNPITNNVAYYAIVINKDTIQLANSKSLAKQKSFIDFNGSLNNRSGILHTTHNAIVVAYVKKDEGQNIIDNLSNQFSNKFENMKFSTNFLTFNNEIIYHDEDVFRRI